MMIDLHTHSLLSDGQLLPFELARRAAAKGLRAIAITDHVDASNIDFVVPRLARAIGRLMAHTAIDVVAGAEITHAPPPLIAELVNEARRLGAAVVVVHGETLSEPVEKGTNRAGIESGCDILSHPGLITEDDVVLAAEKGVALEITARKTHSMANGHVAHLALKHGASMVVNTDAHAPGDLITGDEALQILLAADVDGPHADAVFATSEAILRKALGRTDA